MSNLLVTLPTGVLLLIAVFILLRRLAGMAAGMAGFVLAMVALMGSAVMSMISWPGLDIFAMHLALYWLTLYIAVLLSQPRHVDSRSDKSWRGGPVLLIGFFVMVILLNTVFVVLANYGTDSFLGRWFLPKPRSGAEVHSVFPGTVSHDFREKEEQFNQYQQQREQQLKRGWQVRYGWLDNPTANLTTTLRLTLADKQGKALLADLVIGKFYFAGDSRLDREFTMSAIAPGDYRVATSLPHAGRWDMVILITQGQEQYEIRATTDIESANTP